MSTGWHITRKGILKGCSEPEDRNLIIPDGVKEIAEGAFRWCKRIKRVIIPEGVTRIEAEAFAECHGLKEVIFPKSLHFIGQNAFHGTPWLENYPDDFVVVNHILICYKGVSERIIIPEGVQIIGEGVFCNKVVPHFKVVQKYLRYPVRSVTFPDGLKEIEFFAFCGCDKLTELYFPDSLKYISNDAFKGCTLLKSIRFPESIDGIGFEAFAECPNLERVPLFVSNKKVFYAFPESRGYYYQMHFVDCREYETTEILSPDVRADLMFQIYAYHTDEQGAEKYIRKHFPEMIPVFIRLDDSTLFQQLAEDFPKLIQHVLTEIILEANRQNKHELQIRLMDYQYHHCEFQQKDLYLQ